MIYPISTTDFITYKTSIRDALSSTGKIGTIYYDSGSTIVFSLNGYAGVFKIAASDWFHGDSWTSAATITNQVLIQESYNNLSSGQDCAMVITPKVIAITLNNGTSSLILTIAITTDDNGGNLILAFGASASTLYNNSYSYLLNPTRQEVFPGIRGGTGNLVDDQGFFYVTEIILKDNGSRLVSPSSSGLKLLFKVPSSSIYLTLGDDVSIPAAYTSDGGSYLGMDLLIIGGNL